MIFFIITNLDLGRKWTEDEQTAMQQRLDAGVTAGTTSGDTATDGNADSVKQIVNWTTIKAANAYVEFLNTLTPPPLSVTAHTIE